MLELAEMSDRNFGKVITIRHRIDLTKLGKAQILQNPYRSIFRHRNIEWIETGELEKR